MSTDTSNPCFLQPKFLKKALPASLAFSPCSHLPGVLMAVSAVSVDRLQLFFQGGWGMGEGMSFPLAVSKDLSFKEGDMFWKEQQF